jgi:excisionase family DNA binding protein
MAVQSDSGRRFFTTSEVARYCAVTNDGVLKWIKSGKLRAFSTPGGHYRVSSEDFREFLEKYDIPIDEAFFSGQQRPRTVLVVDDEQDIREIVRRVLREMEPSLRIEEASDGYEAGIKIGSLQPDLVVLDVMMPGMSGWEVCRAIREDRQLADTGVLMLTGIGERLNELTSPLYGADAFLDKPFSFEDLDRKVAEIFAGRSPREVASRA